MSLYIILSFAGAILFNLIVSIITNDWRMTIIPKTKSEKLVHLAYLILSFIPALLYLTHQIGALGFLIPFLGAQIGFQLYIALKKLIERFAI